MLTFSCYSYVKSIALNIQFLKYSIPYYLSVRWCFCMITALDVEANRLIEKAAQELKSMNIEKPGFVGYVKTGPSAERPPESADFWYVRCASLLRQAYVRGTIGVNRMRTHYGGKKNRGVRPHIHVKSGGKTIRSALQSLEKAGLLTKLKAGRALSPKGRKFMDALAKTVATGAN